MTITRISASPHLLTLLAFLALVLILCLPTADASHYPLGRYRRWDYYGGDGGFYGWGGRWWSRDRRGGNGFGGRGPGGRFGDGVVIGGIGGGVGGGGGGGGLPSVGINFPGEHNNNNNNNVFVSPSDPQPTSPVRGGNGITSIGSSGVGVGGSGGG